jgi:hypothetical protein
MMDATFMVASVKQMFGLFSKRWKMFSRVFLELGLRSIFPGVLIRGYMPAVKCVPLIVMESIGMD